MIICERIVRSVNYSKYSLIFKYDNCYYMFCIKCIELALAFILGLGAAALHIILSFVTPILSLQFVLFNLLTFYLIFYQFYFSAYLLAQILNRYLGSDYTFTQKSVALAMTSGKA